MSECSVFVKLTVLSVFVVTTVAAECGGGKPIPSAGTFAATGSMTTMRGGPAVTLLSDGKVLVAGGGYDTSAEHRHIYRDRQHDRSESASLAHGDLTGQWEGACRWRRQ
jgi:hypothetical protein